MMQTYTSSTFELDNKKYNYVLKINIYIYEFDDPESHNPLKYFSASIVSDIFQWTTSFSSTCLMLV